MQFRNIFLLLFFSLLLFSVDTAIAQKITTNEYGDKIILYPDGSWRYFDNNVEKGDSENSADQFSDENKSNASLSPEDVRKQLIKEYRIELIKVAERAAAEEKYANRNYEDVQFERELIEDELEEATNSSDTPKSEINEIKQRLKEAKKQEKEALDGLNFVTDSAKEADEKTMLSDDEVYKLVLARNDHLAIYNKPKNPNTKSSSKSKWEKKKVFASFDPKDDVILNPPDRNCKLTFDGVDDFSGKKRKEVEKGVLFSYTSDEMRPYLKDKSFITCEAYVSSLSGGYKFLSLEITIASENAQRDYGIIEKGSILNIKLMDETNVKLFNNKTDVGIPDELNGSVTYTAQYVVSSGAEKVLRKNEVDKIRVIWSSGYEDYEVYDLDFFVNQFKCLNGK